jgi:hypothetical protein
MLQDTNPTFFFLKKKNEMQLNVSKENHGTVGLLNFHCNDIEITNLFTLRWTSLCISISHKLAHYIFLLEQFLRLSIFLSTLFYELGCVIVVVILCWKSLLFIIEMSRLQEMPRVTIFHLCCTIFTLSTVCYVIVIGTWRISKLYLKWCNG